MAETRTDADLVADLTMAMLEAVIAAGKQFAATLPPGTFRDTLVDAFNEDTPAGPESLGQIEHEMECIADAAITLARLAQEHETSTHR